MEFLHEYNAVIRQMALPNRVKAFTVYDSESGMNNIYVNIKLAQSEQCKAVLHEIEHIKKGHFNTEHGRSVNDIELGMSG